MDVWIQVHDTNSSEMCMQRHMMGLGKLSRPAVVEAVCWTRMQDGSTQAGVPSAQLLPVLHVDEHDFWPGEYVQNKVDESEEVHADGARRSAALDVASIVVAYPCFSH